MDRSGIRQTVEGMTLRQKLGQLIISRPNITDVREIVRAGEIGGFYFAGTALDNLKENIEELKSLSPFPLFFAQDLELGKTGGGPNWSSAMAVSSAGSPEDAYLWAYCHARQARSFGINAVFGPVLDISLNPLAENTGFRSVGSDPETVAEYGELMMRGYSDAGVYSFAKHYPGFGRAAGDPHMELAVLKSDYNTLFEQELLPYRNAIEKGCAAGIMSGHVLAEAVDRLPTTLSKKWVDILRRDLGFEELLLTDSLSMQGILQFDNSKYLYENVLIAGHDMFLSNFHLTHGECLDLLEDAVDHGRLPLEAVEEKVRRILAVKYRLEEFVPLLWSEDENRRVYERISRKAPSYLRRDGAEFEPLRSDLTHYFLVFTNDQAAISGELSSTAEGINEIIRSLTAKLPNIKIDLLPLCPQAGQIQRALNTSLDYDRVTVIANTTCFSYTGFDCLSYQAQSVIRSLRHKTDTLVIVGNPYAYKAVEEYVKQVLFAYNLSYDIIADVLSGDIKPVGKLPVRL